MYRRDFRVSEIPAGVTLWVGWLCHLGKVSENRTARSLHWGDCGPPCFQGSGGRNPDHLPVGNFSGVESEGLRWHVYDSDEADGL